MSVCIWIANLSLSDISIPHENLPSCDHWLVAKNFNLMLMNCDIRETSGAGA